MGKMVHLRIPDTLYVESEKYAKEFGFHSLQEYVRNAVRTLNEEYKKKHALYLLEKNYGRGKGTKRMTKEERQAWAEEQIKKDPSDVFRRIGWK